jgi:hypothetical protein
MVGGTKISVLARSEQDRRDILDTARPITRTDAYGCTPTDTAKASGFPTEPVDRVEICEYFGGKLVAGSSVPPRRAAQLGRSLTDDSKRPTPTPVASCVDNGPQTYVVKLHAGAKSWTVRVQNSSCVYHALPSTIALGTGPHGPSDPSALFDGVRPVIPPQR